MPRPTPVQHRQQEGDGQRWLQAQPIRNYEPFLSARWRAQERLFQAIRTGRLVPRPEVRARDN
jgi:hypothetical protein